MICINKLNNYLGSKLLSTRISFIVIIGIILVSRKHLYINLYNIKFIKILKLLNKCKEVRITGTGVLIIFYENKIIKYPLGKYSRCTLKSEYRNYLNLKISNISNMVDYLLEKKDDYYIMDKLKASKSSVRDHKKICMELSKMKNRQYDLLKSFEWKQIDNILPSTNGKDLELKIYKILDFIKTKKIVNRCPMHGDLTKFNIMKNVKDVSVLIDLDRFNFEGFENIDRIHFAIEYYAKKENTDFFKIIENILIHRKISMYYFYFMFFYFIYRINIEHNIDIKMPLSYENNVYEILNLFIKKHNS